MSFVNMWKELALDIGGMPGALARTRINEALEEIYDETLWSFQLGEGGWLTPPLVNSGTITVQPYTNTVVGDAVATAAWAAMVGRPFITEQQIRVPAYALYNVIAYDDGTTAGQGNAPYATLTLDRLWMEPAQVNQGYMLYQAYVATPVADFKRFISIRDMSNMRPLDFRSWRRADLAAHDPQRTALGQPTRAVPYQVDTRPTSPTLGSMLYELWPHPVSAIPYSLDFIRRGQRLASSTDQVPWPLTEALVKWVAKENSYLWKESQKGEDMQRGSGANWIMLAEAARTKYEGLLKECMKRDRDMVDLFTTKLRRHGVALGAFLDSTGSRLTLGE